MRHLVTPNATQQMRRYHVRLTDVLETISRSEQHSMQGRRHVAERRTASGELLRVVYLRRPYPVIITVLRVQELPKVLPATEEQQNYIS